jgi:hypothetical protein
MKAPPAKRPEHETAPPIKRANPDGIAVRLYDGTLVAHVNAELADRIIVAGDAEACRSGSRRYLRLRQDISVPRTERGWKIIEFLRSWHGDKWAAGYVAHKDRQSERLRYQPPNPTTDIVLSVQRPTGRTAAVNYGKVSAPQELRGLGGE